MTKGIALLLAGSALALGAPAHAQEDHGFSGPWIAGVGGYDKNQAGSTSDDDINDDNDQSAEGLVWGGAVGYDVDLGTMVIGAEAELTESTADTNSVDGDPRNLRPRQCRGRPRHLRRRARGLQGDTEHAGLREGRLHQRPVQLPRHRRDGRGRAAHRP
jgi:hypothetical protein